MGTLVRAEILAVGSELLTPVRADTNSLYLTARLNECGLEVRFKGIVGDARDEVAACIRQMLERADLVVVTGGLGPTEDDVTREAVADVLGVPLEEDPAIIARLEARFAARGWSMPERHRRQALVPRGAVVLENAHGTAPGLWIEHGARVLVVLPGPPRELQPMVETHVVPRLRARTGSARLVRRVLKITGRTESQVEDAVRPFYADWRTGPPPMEITILATPGQIELHLAVRETTPGAAEAALERAVAEARGVLGADLVSADGRSLEEVVGALLAERGARVAVAESCTGGLLTSRLTDVSGSSAYVERAIVAYSNRAKIELLGVPEPLLATHGAVSEPVAEAMAAGVRARAAVDWGIGVTGIAGPTGGTPAKPVGTVAVAVVGPDRARTRSFRFPGGREQVKFQAAQAALDLLRRLLLGA